MIMELKWYFRQQLFNKGSNGGIACDIQKTNSKMACVNPILSVSILNINRINTLIKRKFRRMDA